MPHLTYMYMYAATCRCSFADINQYDMGLFRFVMTITVKNTKENIVEEYYATTHSVHIHVGQHACKHTMTFNPNYTLH